MQLKSSALKHGIETEDTLHAWRNAWVYRHFEYHGESRLLVIGPARDGSFLELIVVEADQPRQIIHSDRLRPKFYSLLTSR